jgi:exodeoxyribonuclease V gamma subunit
LQRAVFEQLLAGTGADAMQARLRARGLLPSGALGRRALAEVVRAVQPYAQGFTRWRGDAPAQSIPLEVEIDGLRLHGRIADAWPHGIARLRFGAPNGPSVIRNGLDWLLASAAGVDLPFHEFQEVDKRIGPHRRAMLAPAQARDALRVLLELRAKGLRQPLLFAPRSGWAYYSASTPDRGLKAARSQWQGGEKVWAEGGQPAYALALRARDPFASHDAMAEFARTATAVFAALASGISIAPELDQAALARAPLAGDDDE